MLRSLTRLKVAAGTVAASLFFGALCVGAYFGFLQWSGNFHEVVQGELYRSAQPTMSQLQEYKTRFGIRTVVNLRGENVGSGWYRDEVAASDRLGMTLVDFKMSAKHKLSPSESARLIEIMRSAPKPLLIHCKSGIDRTGLASALYLAGVKSAGEEQAEAQLSLRYGHLSLSAMPYAAMDDSFELMEPSFGYAGS
jgi:protein tyrosine/serine phosphatase